MSKIAKFVKPKAVRLTFNPAIVGTPSSQFRAMLPVSTAGAKRVRSATAQCAVRSQDLLQRLSYTHLQKMGFKR